MSLRPARGPNEYSLGDIFRAVRRHALLVAWVTVPCVAVAALVAVREQPMFRATAVLRFTDPRRSIPQGIAPVERDPTPASSMVLSQMELLRSKTLIGLVVDSLNLRLQITGEGLTREQLEGIHFAGAALDDTLTLEFTPTGVAVRFGKRVVTTKYGDTLVARAVSFVVPKRPSVSTAALAVRTRDEAIDWFDSRLEVTQKGETELVDVRFTHSDPALAQSAVNTLVDRYGRWNVASAQAAARQQRLFLREQLAEIDDQRLRAERALTDFRRRQQGYGSREKIQAQQTALFTLDMRRQELDADRSVARSLLQRIEYAKTAKDANALRAVFAAPDLSSNPAVAQISTQLAHWQAARDSMTGGSWSSALTNPDVKQIDERIALAEQRLVAILGGQVSALDARIGALDTLRRRTAGSLQALPLAQSTEEQLQRDVETHRTLAAALRADYENARMAEAVNLGTMEVVDHAALPYQPLGNLRLAKLMLGLLVGLLLGSVGAMVRDVTDVAIRRRDELEGDMRIAVLSIIPGFESVTFRDWRRALLRLGTLGRNGNGDRTSIPPSPSAVVTAPRAASEAYRMLRTNLTSLNAGNGVEGQAVVVTSALMREGKTTVAVNLALSFALEGKRTLLVDADLRRSRIHQVFRVPRAPGLAQVLRGYADPPAVVRPTFVNGLYVLTAGKLRANPSDLLSADRMRKLLSLLTQHFDTIVIDTPPVLPVADATIIAPLAGGVLIVVRAGATEREAFDEALHSLERVDARIMGAVLNDAAGEAGRYQSDVYAYEAAD